MCVWRPVSQLFALDRTADPACNIMFPDCVVRRPAAAIELDSFQHILEMEGVTVRRPEVRSGDFDRPVSTPDFESKTQLYAAMPRDILIVVSSLLVLEHALLL